MNKLWISIILLSLLYGLFTGRLENISSAILNAPMEGLDLVVTLVFSSVFWSGIMMILYDSGFIDGVAKALSPLLNRIMPNLKSEEAKKYIASNVAANMFGLGFAATPAGLKAMQELKKVSLEEKDTASDEMVTFLVLNTAGVTLINTSILALNAKFNSSSPTEFMPYTIIGTLVSIVVGLSFDFIFRKINKK